MHGAANMHNHCASQTLTCVNQALGYYFFAHLGTVHCCRRPLSLCCTCAFGVFWSQSLRASIQSGPNQLLRQLERITHVRQQIYMQNDQLTPVHVHTSYSGK